MGRSRGFAPRTDNLLFTLSPSCIFRMEDEKTRRKRLPLSQRLLILHLYREGGRTQDSLAKQFGLSCQGAISKILSTTATSHPSPKTTSRRKLDKILSAREGKHPELEKALLQWIYGEQGKFWKIFSLHSLHRHNKMILDSTGGQSSVPSNAQILQKAIELFPRIYRDRSVWQPSPSWVIKFKTRHGIMELGESKASSQRCD